MKPLRPIRRPINQRREFRRHEIKPPVGLPRRPLACRTRLRARRPPSRLADFAPLFTGPSPHPFAARGDLIHAPPCRDAAILPVEDRCAVARLGRLIPFLDQQPVVRALARGACAHAHKHPTPSQPFTMQLEFEMAVCIPLCGIAKRIPCPAVPHHHRAAAIRPFGNDPFEVGIGEGVILDMNRESFVARIQTRPFGHRPALQGAAEFKAKVVMQPPCSMLLHHEAAVNALHDRSARLRRRPEIALRPVSLQILAAASPA